MLQGQTGTLEFKVVGLRGGQRWLDTHAAPLRGPQGEVTALLGITRDITERKRAEQEREQMESQLRQAQKMEALGTLSGGIAHDFNNILAAILGNVALARQDTGAGHAAQQSLDEIAKAGARARDLVQQILAFSRQQPQQRSLLDLREVAHDAGKMLRASLPANIDLVTRLAADCPSVLGDRTQLHQVLMNLGTNAWHAMGTQGGRIEIALEAVLVNGEHPVTPPPLDSGLRRNDDSPVIPAALDSGLRRNDELPVVPAPSVVPAQAGTQSPTSVIPAPSVIPATSVIPAKAGIQTLVNGLNLPAGRYVHLSVKDNGRGMDEATRGRIFDPFFTTKAPGEGTGLGLSVVDGIVKGHGGAITCYSQVGVGSSFHLVLPAQQQQDVDAAQTQSQTQTEAQPQAQAGKGKGQRILFLDDEEALVLMSTRLLERLGYQVQGFSDSHEALAAFQADPEGFDLLVTDFNMPGPSGLEVASQMRKIRPDLPVALASGYVTDELREKAAALGILEVLYKPTAVEGLVEAIDRLLDVQK